MASNSFDEAFSIVMGLLSRKDTESVSILCSLLQQPHEDDRTVKVATYALISIAKKVCLSPDGIAELCQSGFIPSTFRALVTSALPHHILEDLLHVYVTISSESFEASQALFELDLGRVAKDNIAPSSCLCRGTLELIEALLPKAWNRDDRIQLQKVKFLRTRTELVEKLGKDVVPLLVVSGGADSYISYGLRIIKKLIGLCSSEFLVNLLKSVNISSFLAGAFTRHHRLVLLLAPQTSELILNLSSEFVQSFLKEGVFFSIALLCYAFDQGHSIPSSHDRSAKLEKDSVHNLAKYIKSRYFPSKLSNSDETLSVLWTQLSDMTNDDAQSVRQDDIFSSLLDHIFAKLSGSEPISALELVGGGIVKLLTEYLSDTKRIRVFARRFISSSEAMATLVQKLQTGLFLLETFPQKRFPANILKLLGYLAHINSSMFDMIYEERIEDFTRGKLEDLESLKISIQLVPQIELLNTKLTERLQQEMRDSIPTWSKGLIVPYPFLFGFDARRKFFELDAFGALERPFSYRDQFLVSRDRILESASQMMELFSGDDRVMSIKYKGELGSGPGPTREFYTLLSHELQDAGTGMWREDSSGLFPRPLNDVKFVSQVRDKFVLLGRTVARALRERRVLDLRFSKAFIKLILGKELRVYDVLLFDQALGRTLIEFTALVRRKEYLESAELECEMLFRGTRIEDLCLDFTLPGYPNFVLGSGLEEEETVTMQNLKDYISLVLDATIGFGISNQVEAFKYGFNQLFPMKKMEVFTEEELERLLCGESECWSVDELVDHVKFGDGYTATSPPMLNLFEIIAEFDKREQRAFLQFVTGTPRLPVGGFGSLNPNLTILRKASIEELPSVMTCVNYLKMPPYSSKQVMRQKLLYAITEGQGSFEFS